MREDHPDWPPIVLVYQGNAEQGEALLKSLWPDAPLIADPEQSFWKALDVQRAPFRQLFGLRVWKAALGSFLRGHFIGRPVGDPLLAPGAFLVQDGEVQWRFTPEHAGDLAGEPHLSRALSTALKA